MNKLFGITALTMLMLGSVQASESVTREDKAQEESQAEFSLNDIVTVRFINLDTLAGSLWTNLKSADGGTRVQKIVSSLIAALNLGEEKVTFKSGVTTELKNIIDLDELKDLLQRMNRDYYKSEDEQNPIKLRRKYLKCLFKKVVKQENLQKFLGVRVVIKATFKNIIAFMKDNPLLPIEQCVDLKELPAIFGFNISENFETANLGKLIDAILQKKEISKDMVLSSTNLKPFLRWLGCAENSLEKESTNALALFSFLYDILNSPESAPDVFFKLLRTGGFAPEAKKQIESPNIKAPQEAKVEKSPAAPSIKAAPTGSDTHASNLFI